MQKIKRHSVRESLRPLKIPLKLHKNKPFGENFFKTILERGQTPANTPPPVMNGTPLLTSYLLAIFYCFRDIATKTPETAVSRIPVSYEAIPRTDPIGTAY